MTSFLLRRTGENPGHVYIDVYAGPTREHRAMCGSLIFRPDEADLFEAAFTSGGEHVNAFELERVKPKFGSSPSPPRSPSGCIQESEPTELCWNCGLASRHGDDILCDACGSSPIADRLREVHMLNRLDMIGRKAREALGDCS